MNTIQWLSVAVIGLMVVGFIWNRLRYDIVAALSLAVAGLLGVVAPKEVFRGFSDDIIWILASALVMSAGISRSGALDPVFARMRQLKSIRVQLITLVLTVAFLSAVVKNVAALALTMPVAFQIAKRTKVSPSIYLMPMAFGALMGGMLTLIGTSPNIVVSRVRTELAGMPFQMLDFTPVALCILLAGTVFLAFGYKLIPADRRGAGTLAEAVEFEDYVIEVKVPADSAMIGKSLADLGKMGEGVRVDTLMRNSLRSVTPLPDATLMAGDILILKGEQQALIRLVEKTNFEHESQDRPIPISDPEDRVSSIQGVIAPTSPLVGRTARESELYALHGVNLIAIVRSGTRQTQRLREAILDAGDLIVLRGVESQMGATLKAIGVLPLAGKIGSLGERRMRYVALAVLFGAVGLVISGVLPVAQGFALGALMMVLTRVLPVREAYDAIEWPILVLVAALIPVSDALQKHGVTDILSTHLSAFAATLPVWGALAIILAAAMAVTPFFNNTATVLILAPIAAGFATKLGYRPEPFLMAVAIGAGSDYLTPIGHQCNTLVLGPGGYRFGDYARLGTPLSILTIVIGVPALLFFWPAL